VKLLTVDDVRRNIAEKAEEEIKNAVARIHALAEQQSRMLDAQAATFTGSNGDLAKIVVEAAAFTTDTIDTKNWGLGERDAEVMFGLYLDGRSAPIGYSGGRGSRLQPGRYRFIGVLIPVK